MPIITKATIADPHSILVLRLSALGDVAHCLPALEALHELWPDARIDWVSESLGATLIEGHPRLTRIWRLPRKEWRRAFREPGRWESLLADTGDWAHRLRRHRYDLLVDFQGNFRSLVTSFVARHGRRVTHHPSETKEHSGLIPSHHPGDPAGPVHRVRKNLHLVRALGWAGDEPRGRLPDYGPERQDLLTRAPELGRDAPVILHPAVSAFGRFKEWPRPYFGDLARRLAPLGHPILISWGPGEREMAEEIAEASGGAAVLAPPTSTPRELAAFLGFGRVMIAGDTGPAHLAALLDVPVVSLFGPKSPEIYAPWTPRRSILRSPAPCSPCTLRRCDHAVCMTMVHPAEVADAVRRILP